MGVSSTVALQQALVAALAAAPGIAGIVSGVFDGPPARAPFPYLALGESLSFDWSTKTEQGREHRVALLGWDAGDQSPRLLGLLAAAAAAIEAMPADLAGGHRIASLVLVRERLVRDPAGPLAGLLDYRVRTLRA